MLDEILAWSPVCRPEVPKVPLRYPTVRRVRLGSVIAMILPAALVGRVSYYGQTAT
ncbi:hypothetical protein R6Y94_31575 [Plantactinospora sp. KLBMP9567]|nr:hypothetical protein [Plantactinospora sp. KLBMP9567]